MNTRGDGTERRAVGRIYHPGERTHIGVAMLPGDPGAVLPLRALEVPTRTGSGIAGEAREIALPKIGLQLARQMPFDSWVRIGRQLSAVVNASSWCLGDWLAYGEAAYCGRYRDAVEVTSLDYQTLRNYAWVAKRFPLSRRLGNLSFAHHAEVAALPVAEQDFWLRKALEFGWSRNRLRGEVRASLRERRAGRSDSGEEPRRESVVERPPASSSEENVLARTDPVADEQVGQDDITGGAYRLEVSLTSEQVRLCREAASREGLPVHEWALQVLRQAASNIIRTRMLPLEGIDGRDLGHFCFLYGSSALVSPLGPCGAP